MYKQNENLLTVGVFLKILKFAISIAEIVKSEDKCISTANLHNNHYTTNS